MFGQILIVIRKQYNKDSILENLSVQVKVIFNFSIVFILLAYGVAVGFFLLFVIIMTFVMLNLFMLVLV